MTAAAKGVPRTSFVFREVNERINGISEAWRDGEARDLLCECGDEGCTGTIAVLELDYRRAREQPDRFLLAAGHVDTAGMRILQARDGYAVVELIAP